MASVLPSSSLKEKCGWPSPGLLCNNVATPMPNLLARKPLNLLMEEARTTGEHCLKRTLGVVQLTALGVGAVIGAGIFVMAGLGAHYAGPGLMLSFVLSGL